MSSAERGHREILIRGRLDRAAVEALSLELARLARLRGVELRTVQIEQDRLSL